MLKQKTNWQRYHLRAQEKDREIVGEHCCAMTTSETSKVQTQPEVAGTGATTHWAGNAQRRVMRSFLSNASLHV